MSAPRTETSFPFIREWFEKAATTAAAQGRRDSAQLWRDGLQHLDHFKAQLDAAQTAAYAEGRKDEREEWEKRILPLLQELHADGTLSEGQCAKYWGGAILDWRMASRAAPHPFAQEGGDE